MRSRNYLLVVFLFFTSFSIAQDSIVPNILPDSVMEGEIDDVDNYMAEGYFDKVPFYDSLATVDSSLFKKLSAPYRTEEFDYENENIEQIGFFKKIFDRIGRWLSNLLPDGEYFQFADVFYNILAGLAVILLLWIIYRVIFSGKRLLAPNDEADATTDEIRFVEKNLLDIDLLSYIEQAKQQDDFAKAIRYLNLLNIQLLAKKGIVQWRSSKTNVELIEEIQQEEIKQEFSHNVNVFNRIWYGDEPIDKLKYEYFSSYFLNFQTKWA